MPPERQGFFVCGQILGTEDYTAPSGKVFNSLHILPAGYVQSLKFNLDDSMNIEALKKKVNTVAKFAVKQIVGTKNNKPFSFMLITEQVEVI